MVVVADMEVDMVADMEEDMLADMEVDMMADMVSIKVSWSQTFWSRSLSWLAHLLIFASSLKGAIHFD